jgi:hypothetical protein
MAYNFNLKEVTRNEKQLLFAFLVELCGGGRCAVKDNIEKFAKKLYKNTSTMK